MISHSALWRLQSVFPSFIKKLNFETLYTWAYSKLSMVIDLLDLKRHYLHEYQIVS